MIKIIAFIASFQTFGESMVINPMCIHSKRESCRNNSPVVNQTTSLSFNGIDHSDVGNNASPCQWDEGEIVNDTCSMTVDEDSKKTFTDLVTRSHLNFVHIKLNFNTFNTEDSKCAVLPSVWTWTFIGENGGFEFFKMNSGFGIYSLGILNAYESGPILLNINVQGSCRIQLGTVTTTNRIKDALQNITHRLAGVNTEYSNTRWCFHERTYIHPKLLYHLCHYIVCPIESLNYRCCDGLSCNNNVHYRNMWWACPVAVGYVIFAFFPVLLLGLAAKVSQSTDLTRLRYLVKMRKKQSNDPETEYLLSSTKNGYHAISDHESANIEYEYIFETSRYPLTLSYLVFQAVIGRVTCHSVMFSRLIRIAFIICTTILVVLNIVLHWYYLNDLTVARIQKAEPMAFLSVLAGLKESRKNFLCVFGGPCLALFSYFVIGSLLVAIPKDFQDFLETGIPDNETIVTSPLNLDLQTLQRFGTLPVVSRNGYAKIETVLCARVSMLLNSDFWQFAIQKQTARFKVYYKRAAVRSNKAFACVIRTFIFIPYILFSCAELIVCLFFYGIPMVSFIIILRRAYCKKIFALFTNAKNGVRYMFLAVLTGLCMCCGLFFVIYIFSLVFTFSFMFVVRVALYTYTGMFVYPERAYSFLIFFFYSVLYFSQSVSGFSKVYKRLFSQVIEASHVLQTSNVNAKIQFLKFDGRHRGILIDLFEFVVDHRKPRRIEIFKSLLKMIIYCFLLYVSIFLIIDFDRWNKINSTLNIVTIIFIGGVPRLVASVFASDEENESRLAIKEIKETILSYWKIVSVNDTTSENPEMQDKTADIISI